MDEKVNNKSKKISFKWFIILQSVVMVYTLSGVFAKFASGTKFLSPSFLFFYGLEILILGVYAILWQQIIKKFDLSIAYANRSCALLWSMIWSVLFFNEIVTLKNLIGVSFVIIGTFIVNKEDA